MKNFLTFVLVFLVYVAPAQSQSMPDEPGPVRGQTFSADSTVLKLYNTFGTAHRRKEGIYTLSIGNYNLDGTYVSEKDSSNRIRLYDGKSKIIAGCVILLEKATCYLPGDTTTTDLAKRKTRRNREY